MKSTPLTAIAGRFGLDERQCAQMDAVLGVLAGDERAPTTVREPRTAVDIHLADSLIALDVEAVRRAGEIADIGAGAGFPGLALAVALPRATVSLIESQTRKAAFIERVCATAEIANASAVCARAEEWQDGLAASDVVTARAVAPQPVVLEYAAPLLRLGGVLVDWRGRREPAAESAASVAACELGMRLVEIRHVQPYDGARDHHLHVYKKEAPTPQRFPRRAGIARKRPLAAATAQRTDPPRR